MADEDELIDEEEGGEYNFVTVGIAVAVLLLLIGGAVWYFMFRTPPEEKAEIQLPKWEMPEAISPDIVYEGLPKMIINPADSDGRYYLQVKVDIAFSKDIRSQLLGKPWLLPQAQNIIIDVFNDYTIDDLQTPKFREEARLEVKRELNRLLGWEGEELPEDLQELDIEDRPPISEVYLVEFILQ